MQEIKHRPGSACPLGVSAAFDGVNFALEARSTAEATLVIYNKGKAILELPMPRIAGDVFAVAVSGLDKKSLAYSFLTDGREIMDPYARKTAGGYLACLDTKGLRQLSPKPNLNKRDLILYELHIKGFAGSFLKTIDKIPYLLKLGINGLMLMPAFEFDEENGQYWGYAPKALLAPKESYGAKKGEQCKELKKLVEACHQNAMEVYLDLGIQGLDEAILNAAVSHYVSAYQVDGFKVAATVDLAKPHLKACKLFYDYDSAFTNNTRRFLKGENGLVYSLAAAMEWGGENVHCAGCHDGLTLMDWAKDLTTAKNALTMAVLGRGIPLITMGDEMGFSQNGNPDAYNVDKPLDWKLLKTNADLFSYACQLTALRRQYPCLRFSPEDGGFPPVSCHGTTPWQGDFFGHTLCMLYAGDNAFIYVMFNQNSHEQAFTLPELPQGYAWQGVLRSDEKAFTGPINSVPGCTSFILIGLQNN